jgi:hypothetical protein
MTFFERVDEIIDDFAVMAVLNSTVTTAVLIAIWWV